MKAICVIKISLLNNKSNNGKRMFVHSTPTPNFLKFFIEV